VKSEHDSCSDVYVMSNDDDDDKKIMDIETEEETDIETQQEALGMTLRAENFEREVSLPCVHYKTVFTKMLDTIDLHSFLSLSVGSST